MARQRSAKAAVEGEWVLGRRRAPIVIEGPTAYRPDLVLVVEAASGFVIASEVVHPEASADEVAARVEGVMKPGVTLRVDDEQIADALRARLGPDQPVRVGPVPELRAPLAALSRFVGRGGGSRREEPLWTDEASAEARIGFFQAATQFERSAPWEVAGDGQVLRVDVPALGWDGACASILGAAGEEFGLLLLRSVEDYVAFGRLAGEAGRPARRRRAIGIPLLSVNFDHPDAITGGKVLAKRARAHGWKPGPEGRLAYLVKVSPDSVVQPITTDDYRLATASLEAVRVFVEKNLRLFQQPPTERIETQSRIVMPAGELEVRVTAPPDDLPWAWGEEEPIDGLRRLESETLLEAFLDAHRASGASEEEVGHAREVVDEALRFKAGRGEPGDRWKADDVEEYLLRHYPARGGAPDEELELVPASLDAFLEWLGTLGKGRVVTLRAARERLARCRERFLADARDPRRFGPAKTLLRAMVREGVDPTDSRAVEAFMAQFNERVQKDPSLMPLPTDLPHGARAWVWTPDQPPPDPRGPCPCGSGKRYRKCCMPR
ncbi:MAG TPA: SEC-C domain-containing protein [Vicinamibacteria bacterium]|nr:SEC-C domain-containing protein [Vicinamibacteria bacterium]